VDGGIERRRERGVDDPPADLAAGIGQGAHVGHVKGLQARLDARGQTGAEGVFAAGDATTTPYKQIIIATGEGAKASLSAFDYLIRTKTA